MIRTIHYEIRSLKLLIRSCVCIYIYNVFYKPRLIYPPPPPPLHPPLFINFTFLQRVCNENFTRDINFQYRNIHICYGNQFRILFPFLTWLCNVFGNSREGGVISENVIIDNVEIGKRAGFITEKVNRMLCPKFSNRRGPVTVVRVRARRSLLQL